MSDRKARAGRPAAGGPNMAALVQRLQHGTDAARLRAAKEAARLMLNNVAQQEAFFEAGGGPALTSLLDRSIEAGSEELQETAIILFAACCMNSLGGEAALARCGAVASLVGLLRHSMRSGSGSGSGKLVERAAEMLLEAATSAPEAAHAAVSAGAVPLCVQLLDCSWPAVRTLATEALGRLMEGNHIGPADVAQVGGIEAAVQLLQQTERDSGVTNCLHLLLLLVQPSPQLAERFVAAGGVAAVAARCVPRSNDDVLHLAAVLLSSTAISCPHLLEEFVAAGGAAAFETLLSSPRADTRRVAALNLDRLMRAVPGVAGAQQRTPRVCAAPGCGATSGLKRCAGCERVRYCSAACQRAHWQEHKAECRRLREAAGAAAAAEE